ncbi:MAG: indole-3-glycerol phosphate synthase TrpC [Chitinophagaceae bacterium]|nr:MAG: indole-3-glycerol phosphate synthase TrpC [Chitinophagaceae bacterium]
MNILDKILLHKREEIEVRKGLVTEAELMASKYFHRPCTSLMASLKKPTSTGIIAEFKRKSPSKGFINQHADVETITTAYTNANAAGLSVLTDHEFFGGSTNDLVKARECSALPILRKDFIVDTYQIMASKAMGADVILLIAACLTKSEVQFLAAFAKEIKLEVILELHDEGEIDHICESVDMVGINNRNLKTFAVDINRSLKMAKLLPIDCIKIAESGINEVSAIKRFRDAGFQGFLMGERFMKEEDPAKAFQEFVSQLNNTTG